eukprot:CAMPEP_0203933098 /NCGR_PEP_ID=MMETSP0359-20131031/71356_1 /ASSEMBLY_ACC=CAM_ASM_000338 /TAXON_ID=268821 /ORGANISM="Scrippsiella Hangoei, Strain SHTV-5" /LENGTH=361 /DNA_ID=CAMNT_0050862627 /DNA_START=54 /DNA_END=1139 /DNA_ORIENTATION=+
MARDPLLSAASSSSSEAVAVAAGLWPSALPGELQALADAESALHLGFLWAEGHLERRLRERCTGIEEAESAARLEEACGKARREWCYLELDVEVAERRCDALEERLRRARADGRRASARTREAELEAMDIERAHREEQDFLRHELSSLNADALFLRELEEQRASHTEGWECEVADARHALSEAQAAAPAAVDLTAAPSAERRGASPILRTRFLAGLSPASREVAASRAGSKGSTYSAGQMLEVDNGWRSGSKSSLRADDVSSGLVPGMRSPTRLRTGFDSHLGSPSTRITVAACFADIRSSLGTPPFAAPHTSSAIDDAASPKAKLRFLEEDSLRLRGLRERFAVAVAEGWSRGVDEMTHT